MGRYSVDEGSNQAEFAEPSSLGRETEQKLGILAEWIDGASSVVWFTGAGISTESGLPDYRGSSGMRARRRKRQAPHARRLKSVKRIKPNPAHFAMVEFEKMGKCDLLVSQNVDNLHLKSGFPIVRLAELHGNRRRLRCHRCEKTFALEDLPKQAEAGERPGDERSTRKCPLCGDDLVKSVVGFGGCLPTKDLNAAREAARNADLMIVVGSSCKVIPASQLPVATKDHGGKVVIMNIGNTDLDHICDLRFDDERAGELLPRLLYKVKALQEDR